MKGVIRAALVLAVLTVGSMMVVSPAHAVSFDLTSCHVSGEVGCGGQTFFGTVTLTQVGANVDFSVVLSNARFVETGAADFQLFKFNGTGITAADIVNEATAPNIPTGGVNGFAGAFNGDGTGTFGFGVACVTVESCNGGSAPIMTSLTFTVLGATIAELTVPNNLGNIFVADLLIGNGQTGPIDATTPNTNVPEPGTLTLLGAGLVALGFAARRRLSIGG